MNIRDLNQMKKNIDKLSIPQSRKELNVHTVRWLIRSQPNLDDRTKTLLGQWLRENDIE